jgi:hypothetical protein
MVRWEKTIEGAAERVHPGPPAARTAPRCVSADPRPTPSTRTAESARAGMTALAKVDEPRILPRRCESVCR